MPVSLQEIDFCPFCGNEGLDTKRWAYGDAKCPECGAVFRVIECDDSEREGEE